MSYWTFNREVGLKGVDGTFEILDNCPRGLRVVMQPNPDNPSRLPDDVILYALRTSRRARADFRRLFPTLLPEEQERLTNLLEANPMISQLVTDDQRIADNIQHKDVTSIPVYTSGPRGGKGWGGRG